MNIATLSMNIAGSSMNIATLSTKLTSPLKEIDESAKHSNRLSNRSIIKEI